jgi:hypothetical protein
MKKRLLGWDCRGCVAWPAGGCFARRKSCWLRLGVRLPTILIPVCACSASVGWAVHQALGVFVPPRVIGDASSSVVRRAHLSADFFQKSIKYLTEQVPIG